MPGFTTLTKSFGKLTVFSEEAQDKSPLQITVFQNLFSTVITNTLF